VSQVKSKLDLAVEKLRFLLQGTCDQCKNLHRAKSNTILSIIYINSCQAMHFDIAILLWCSAGWIGNHGFSIAIHDVKPQNKLINMKRDMIWNGYQRCEALMQNFSDNELHENAGHLAAQNLETKITDELNDICNTLGEVSIIYNKIFCLCILTYGGHWMHGKS